MLAHSRRNFEICFVCEEMFVSTYFLRSMAYLRMPLIPLVCQANALVAHLLSDLCFKVLTICYDSYIEKLFEFYFSVFSVSYMSSIPSGEDYPLIVRFIFKFTKFSLLLIFCSLLTFVFRFIKPHPFFMRPVNMFLNSIRFVLMFSCLYSDR